MSVRPKRHDGTIENVLTTPGTVSGNGIAGGTRGSVFKKFRQLLQIYKQVAFPQRGCWRFA